MIRRRPQAVAETHGVLRWVSAPDRLIEHNEFDTIYHEHFFIFPAGNQQHFCMLMD